MTILKLGGKSVQLGRTKVLIENISAGGIRFSSNIRLPNRADLLLGFEFELLGKAQNLQGHIVWLKEAEGTLLQYGLEFKIKEKEQEDLTALLNHLQVKLRRDPFVSNCSFIKMDKKEYFSVKK